LTGDEKGDAQVFCDRLFQALGHDGVHEAGAVLEARIKKEDNKGTAFADLMWKPRGSDRNEEGRDRSVPPLPTGIPVLDACCAGSAPIRHSVQLRRVLGV
jgi:hypothetical protein